MGPRDYILLLITILLIVEAVVEARRKRWLAFAISIAFLALVTWMTMPIYRHFWNKAVPASTPATP